MPHATATSATASSVATRDVEAENAALSLARRRGKCAPSVDTKLTDAWLGFYVALTKSKTQSRSTEAATQASTEAITETSLSDEASSTGHSPRHAALDGEAETPLTSDTLRESWADASEELSPSPRKRSRRSHRRRRTRGRGKKGQKSGDCPEEECTPIDEEEDGVKPTSDGIPSAVLSTGCSTPTAASAETSQRWPYAMHDSSVCPKAVLPSGVQPVSSPSKACTVAQGAVVSTSPNAVHGEYYNLCEASARTPPRVAFSNSPVACMMSSTPTAFGGLSYQGSPASYYGSHMVISPGGACIGSTCQVQAVQSPAYLGTSPAHHQGYLSTCTHSMPAPAAMPHPTVDAMRSFLTGGLPANGEDLAMRLQAAAPETYED